MGNETFNSARDIYNFAVAKGDAWLSDDQRPHLEKLMSSFPQKSLSWEWQGTSTDSMVPENRGWPCAYLMSEIDYGTIWWLYKYAYRFGPWDPNTEEGKLALDRISGDDCLAARYALVVAKDRIGNVFKNLDEKHFEYSNDPWGGVHNDKYFRDEYTENVDPEDTIVVNLTVSGNTSGSHSGRMTRKAFGQIVDISKDNDYSGFVKTEAKLSLSRKYQDGCGIHLIISDKIDATSDNKIFDIIKEFQEPIPHSEWVDEVEALIEDDYYKIAGYGMHKKWDVRTKAGSRAIEIISKDIDDFCDGTIIDYIIRHGIDYSDVSDAKIMNVLGKNIDDAAVYAVIIDKTWEEISEEFAKHGHKVDVPNFEIQQFVELPEIYLEYFRKIGGQNAVKDG